MLVKLLDANAKVPTQANPGDAGLDLVAVSMVETSMYIEYNTEIAVAIPEGFVGLLCPRSSISEKHLTLLNSLGVIDSGYRGPIKMRFARRDPSPFAEAMIYKIGDKIGQLLLMMAITPKPMVVDELPESQRGTGGFGSSGT